MTRTIDVQEVLWTLAALPGLWLWSTNRLEAGKSFAAAKTIVPRNGRFLWAQFSVFLTNTFVGVELLFVILGVVAMFRPPPPPVGPDSLGRLITVLGLIAASVVISVLAYRWKKVDEEITAAARRRVHPELEEHVDDEPAPLPPDA